MEKVTEARYRLPGVKTYGIMRMTEQQIERVTKKTTIYRFLLKKPSTLQHSLNQTLRTRMRMTLSTLKKPFEPHLSPTPCNTSMMSTLGISLLSNMESRCALPSPPTSNRRHLEQPLSPITHPAHSKKLSLVVMRTRGLTPHRPRGMLVRQVRHGS